MVCYNAVTRVGQGGNVRPIGLEYRTDRTHYIMEPLSPELDASRLQADFARLGYVSIPGFVTGDDLAELIENKKRLIRDIVPTMPSDQAYYEDKDDPSTLKQLQKVYQYDAYFKSVMFGSRFEQLASLLLDEPVVGKNMQYFNKPAGIGQATTPHQDGYFFKLRPNKAVTMWLSLEDITEAQGCVRYVKGSHRMGMRHHAKSGVLGFSQMILDFPQPNDIENEVAFPCQAGHLIVHHSLTIHWAQRNVTTDRTREAMGWIYYGQSAQEDTAAHEAYADQLKQEMAQGGKI